MHFREATAADRDRILALRARCFGDVDPEKRDPRFWDWEFARARIFVGEENGEIVTHLAIVHGLAVDAMTSPDARGKGAFTGVARYAIERSDDDVATAYQIRGAVLGSMLRSGWTIAERVPVLLRPVGWWRGKRETFKTLTREDIRTMSEISGRTPEFIAWRFFDNPHWKYDITGNENVYLVARKTKLKGIDTYAVVDLAWRDNFARAAPHPNPLPAERGEGTRPAHSPLSPLCGERARVRGGSRVTRALLRDAVEEAKAQRCVLVAALVSRNHPAFGLFLRRGFLPGPHWFRLLVHPPVKRRWQVMWADTDHL
jgi:hypothetical protein